MRYKTLSVVLFFTCLLASCLLAGCKTTEVELPEVEPFDEEDMYTERDNQTEYDEASSIIITLDDAGSSATSSSVTIDGSIITITQAGTYVLSGLLSDGQVIVNIGNEDKCQLVLQNVSINSTSSAALYVKQADKVFVTLEALTTNQLTTSGAYVVIDDTNIDAAVFSKEDITFNGEGTLAVSSTYGHGIISKDDLTLMSGIYNINAHSHALSAKDNLKIDGGVYTLIAGSDGLHAENDEDSALGIIYISGGDFTINVSGDGIDASSIVQIVDGTFDIKCNGKGLIANSETIIAGGIINIRSIDDAIHSNATLSITGGELTCAASDDGIHANETLYITGGTITITKSYEGLEALTINIAGGNITILATDDGINAAGGNDSSGYGGLGGDAFGRPEESTGGSIVISGGTIQINASGDGVDSNGNIVICGGETFVSGPTNNGNGALDYNGTGQITGGIFIATGASGMAQNFGTSSTQGSILKNYSSMTTKQVTLLDAEGATLVTFTPAKAYNSVVVSCPALIKGGSYTLSAAGQTATITLSSLIYGNGGGMGGGERP